MSLHDIARDTLAIVLAGGRGSRLGALTAQRAKPALPFAGTLRVIDFVLANCRNAGIGHVAVLTQYRAQELIRHLAHAPAGRGGEVECVPAQQQTGGDWYLGTADAVHQNLALLHEHRARLALVLAGDHVYRMDYRPMLEAHLRRGAELTLACVEVPIAEARAFGVVDAAPDGRVLAFAEKPALPRPLPGRPDRALVSMGLYVAAPELLAELLAQDAADAWSTHDFGHDLLPRLVGRGRVHVHRFDDGAVTVPGREPYWRDIGTPAAYWAAHMDLLQPQPPLDLHDPHWPVSGAATAAPAARFDGTSGGSVQLADTIVAPGCVVAPARLRCSVLGTGVQIGGGSDIDESVLLPGVVVGRRVRLRRAIVDAGCRLPDGFEAGFDEEADRTRFGSGDEGVVVVAAAALAALPRVLPVRRVA